jgi:competence protein ComEA
MALVGLTLIGRNAALEAGHALDWDAIRRANAAELAELGGVWLAGAPGTGNQAGVAGATSTSQAESGQAESQDQTASDPKPTIQAFDSRETGERKLANVADEPGTGSAEATSPDGKASEANAPQPELTKDGRVVLNTAGRDTLTRLPRVGAKRAEAIVALRTRLGRFRRVTDLLRVKGIGPKTLRLILPHVVLDLPAETAPGDAS